MQFYCRADAAGSLQECASQCTECTASEEFPRVHPDCEVAGCMILGPKCLPGECELARYNESIGVVELKSQR